MRSLRKLVRNGNSTQITIPHVILAHLGWIAGEFVIMTLEEDKTLTLKYPSAEDFVRPSRVKQAKQIPLSERL